MALLCYTCRGLCYQNSKCNCYTGMCEGDYCFSIGEYTEGGAMSVEKGCARKPTMTSVGCEYQGKPTRLLCLCNGTNFCNENPLSEASGSNNHAVSCYDCQSGSYDCSKQCRGDYCLLDTMTKEQSCGFGLPILPFHYQNNELLPPLVDSTDQSVTCASIAYGDNHQQFICACNGSYCNNRMTAREDPWTRIGKRYFTCYKCQSVTDGYGQSACTNGTCIGEFCVLKVRNSNWPKSVYVHTAGCLNSSRSALVTTGCNQRWVLDAKEEIDCACRTDLCNADLSSASRSHAEKMMNTHLTLLFIVVPLVLAYFTK
ncbi:hypothetical protein TTRE_0000353201 [Trichuris trichiura]|uniref:Uncharacterized protein n=1 Tax=Trichuris trichiura TaxID=36087 RepID=A0A077Z9B4_TRITR|nr:hypothetical protein TTRE_0000353201 [Trichuris trichiura]